MVYCDWSSDDSSLLHNISDCSTVINQNVRNLWEVRNSVGWVNFINTNVLSSISLQNAGEYHFRQNSEGLYSAIEEINPFSTDNQTLYSQNDYAKDNTSYYLEHVLTYYKSDYQITYPNQTPDKALFDYPQYGNMINKLGDKMTNEGFGISDIQNSQQTQQLRDKVAEAKTAFNSVFSNDYTSSTINYDLSELGNYFIRAGVMTSNPLINLRGTLRIKPEQGDLHYNIWNMYFNRRNSSYAIALEYSLYVIMYLYFVLVVINDMLSIVDA